MPYVMALSDYCLVMPVSKYTLNIQRGRTEHNWKSSFPVSEVKKLTFNFRSAQLSRYRLQLLNHVINLPNVACFQTRHWSSLKIKVEFPQCDLSYVTFQSLAFWCLSEYNLYHERLVVPLRGIKKVGVQYLKVYDPNFFSDSRKCKIP